MASRSAGWNWVITEANRRGGRDNITAIVVRTESLESATGEQPLRAVG